MDDVWFKSLKSLLYILPRGSGSADLICLIARCSEGLSRDHLHTLLVLRGGRRTADIEHIYGCWLTVYDMIHSTSGTVEVSQQDIGKECNTYFGHKDDNVVLVM